MRDCSDCPVSTMPGERSEPPSGAVCDHHPERQAVSRIQGETDSFGCEIIDLCEECLFKLIEQEKMARSGCCDWCKQEADNLYLRRDYSEGSAGPVYQVCRMCDARMKQEIEQGKLNISTTSEANMLFHFRVINHNTEYFDWTYDNLAHYVNNKPSTVIGDISYVRFIAISPDGQNFVTGGDDNTARLWNMTSGCLIRIFSGHVEPIISAAITPDGKRLITGSYDKSACLWDITSGERLTAFAGHSDYICFVAISPDGEHVVTGSGRTACLYTASGQLLKRYPRHRYDCTPVAITPDGGHIVTGHSKTARLWEICSGRRIRSFSGRRVGAINSLAVTPDGKFLVTGHYDNTFLLWDINSGRLIRSFLGRRNWGNVTLIVVTPDGQYIITGSSDDRNACLWEIASGRLIREFYGYESVEAIAVTPDGKRLVMGNHYTALFWDIDSGKLLGTFYNVNEGFLWTTPPEQENVNGWFWTDRHDMVHVVRCCEDCSKVQLVTDNNVMNNYFTCNNCQKKVIDRINNFQ